MPHYGPWITPAVQTATGALDSGSMHQSFTGSPAETTYALAAESTDLRAPSRAEWLGPVFGGGYSAGQWRMEIEAAAVATHFNDYFPDPSTWPGGASDVDYEPLAPLTTVDWLLDAAVTVPVRVNDDPTVTYPATIQARTWPATDLSSAGTGDPDQYAAEPTPGTLLATFPLRGSAAAPDAVDTTVPVTFDVLPEDINTDGHVGIAGRWFLVVMHYAEQITHVSPPTDGGNWFDVISPRSDWTFSATYQPRRYRFVFDTMPPLRQFPRDDFLGGAPRHGKASTSVQASARVGWTGTYR